MEKLDAQRKCCLTFIRELLKDGTIAYLCEHRTTLPRKRVNKTFLANCNLLHYDNVMRQLNVNVALANPDGVF